MIAAGLMVSELRQALGGRPPANVRFLGEGAQGNRLSRMVSSPVCEHLPRASGKDGKEEKA